MVVQKAVKYYLLKKILYFVNRECYILIEINPLFKMEGMKI